MLLLLSVTVKVTVFGPTLAQVKVFGLTLRLLMPQTSLLPPSTSAAASVPLPVPSRTTVAALHLAVGGVLSTTVTVAVQVATFLLLSVTVKVTVFGPTLAQVKVFGLTLRLLMPQISLLPPSTSAAASVPLPAPSRTTVAALHLAVGGVLSTTVTVAVQAASLLLLPVTVKVTVFGPTFAQVKVFGLTLRLLMPQISLLAPSTSAAASVPLPVPSRTTVAALHLAVGGVLSTTVTVAVQAL